MKDNTKLIGAFVAGLATTYIVQKTKVFGAETRIFGADCNSQGYETNAPNGHTGYVAEIRVHVAPTATNNGSIRVNYTPGTPNPQQDWIFHYHKADAGNYTPAQALAAAKQAVVTKDATGFWEDKTVAANTANCGQLPHTGASCPDCDSCCPTCVDCDSCCPPCPPVVKCNSCCPSLDPKKTHDPLGGEIQESNQPVRGFMQRLFGRW